MKENPSRSKNTPKATQKTSSDSEFSGDPAWIRRQRRKPTQRKALIASDFSTTVVTTYVASGDDFDHPMDSWLVMAPSHPLEKLQLCFVSVWAFAGTQPRTRKFIALQHMNCWKCKSLRVTAAWLRSAKSGPKHKETISNSTYVIQCNTLNLIRIVILSSHMSTAMMSNILI